MGPFIPLSYLNYLLSVENSRDLHVKLILTIFSSLSNLPEDSHKLMICNNDNNTK